jgi:transcriptional regulator of acetoin/glycerol metabolism
VLYRPARLESKHLLAEVPELFVPPEAGEDGRRSLVEALRLTRGNKTEAAKVLGMPRRTLYHKILKYGISEEEFLPPSGRP